MGASARSRNTGLRTLFRSAEERGRRLCHRRRNHWDDAAVIISHGEDFLNWDKVVVPRPKELILLFPESATVYYGHNHFRVICRTYNGWHPMRKLENYKMESAPTAESFDGGRTWTTLKLSNLPLCESQPVGDASPTEEALLCSTALKRADAFSK